MSDNAETAILAGGCFWGVQELLRQRDGVISTRVGYTGGENDNPTYRNHPGHAEAVEIVFDPERISYRDILEFFFQIHDPTTKDRQGNDIGSSYRSEIFYTSDEQRQVAEDTIADVEASGLWPGKVVTEVSEAVPFWEAEPEHQDYLQRTRTATPATSRGRAGSCPTARPPPERRCASAPGHRRDLGEPAHGQRSPFHDQHGPGAVAARGVAHGHVPVGAERLDLGDLGVGHRDHGGGGVLGAAEVAVGGVAVQPAREHGVELLGEGQREGGVGLKGSHARRDAAAPIASVRCDTRSARIPFPTTR